MSKIKVVPVEEREVEKLKPWDKNPKEWSDEALERLKDSIKQDGFNTPLKITTDNVVIGGNARLEAAKQLGLNVVTVQVFQADNTLDRLRIASRDNDEIGSLIPSKLAQIKMEIDTEFPEYDASLLWDDLRFSMNYSQTVDEILEDFSPCSYHAAKYAVERWHYSQAMPAGKTVKIGVWEYGKFIGCVIFSRGANKYIGRPYNLEQTQVCELTRVALNNHHSEVTKIISIALKLLKKNSPGIKLVVSYADSAQGHVGTIYQAGNWLYVGSISTTSIYMKGKMWHNRTVYANYGTQSVPWLRENVDPEAKWVKEKPKFKYLYFYDKQLEQKLKDGKLKEQIKQYPRR